MPESPNWGLLGWALAERRKILNMTQAQVADEADVAINTVGRLESGQPVRRSNLERIAHNLFPRKLEVIDVLLAADSKLDKVVRGGQQELTRQISLGRHEFAEATLPPDPLYVLYTIYAASDEEFARGSKWSETERESGEAGFDELSLPLTIGEILRNGTIRDWRHEGTPDQSMDIITLAVAKKSSGPTKRDLRYWLEMQDRITRSAEDVRREDTPSPETLPADSPNED